MKMYVTSRKESLFSVSSFFNFLHFFLFLPATFLKFLEYTFGINLLLLF